MKYEYKNCQYSHINKICIMISSCNYFNYPVWFSIYVNVLSKQEVMGKLPYMHKESWYVCIAHHLKNVTNWMEVETQLAMRFVLLCTQINARVYDVKPILSREKHFFTITSSVSAVYFYCKEILQFIFALLLLALKSNYFRHVFIKYL